MSRSRFSTRQAVSVVPGLLRRAADGSSASCLRREDGDVIVFWQVSECRSITLDGEACLIMREDEVLAVIETD